MKRNIIAAIVCLFIIASSSAAQDKKQPKKDKVDKVNSTVPAQASKDKKNTPGCDTSFWRYVYNPERLDVLEKCKTVTGIIEESNAAEDVDQPIFLKPDKGQEKMLTKKNKKKKD